jgi:hypothetical protein
MSNKNHSFDGSELTGMVSGFTEYSTRGITSTATPRPVVSPVDVLEQIRELRRALSQEYLAKAIATLDKHIADKNNPHDTSLNDFSDRVIDVLYNYYVENGGQYTKGQYCTMLFKVLHVASTTEMSDGDDSTALVTIAGVRQFLRNHESDPDAHAEIIEHMLPGKPMTEDPIFALLASIGISKGLVHATGVVPYTYVDKSRRISVATDDNPLPQDYTYEEPLFPCFGIRTNEITDSTDYTRCEFHNTAVGSRGIADPMRTATASSIVIQPTNTEVVHEVVFRDITINSNQNKTFSIYVKAGTCNYFSISYNDMAGDTIQVKATYNLTLGKSFMTNHLDRYTADIVPLADGWYRCSFSMYHRFGQQANLVLSCFKEKDPKLQDFKFKATASEVGIYLWGTQFEEGNNASPYIPTSGTTVTRLPVEITVPVLPEFNKDGCTITCAYKSSGECRGNLTRPLVVTLNDNGESSCEIVLRFNNALEAIRWGTISVQNISTRTLTYEDILPDPKGSFVHATHCCNASESTLAYNKTYYTNTGPTYQDPDKSLLVGRDQYGQYAENYLREVVIYPVNATVKQCMFLNGEERNE